jgi:energy-coupling factor transport system substrate-specific component
MSRRDGLTGLLFVMAALIGVVALAYPFLNPILQAGPAAATSLRVGETPLLTAVLIILCLGVLLVEVQGQAANAKTIAVLGVLVAITATLRFIEVGIPGPGGFSPIFAPIILGGYVFGSRFGFLLGAMGMLTSAILTAGVGPWLPYQMFTAGWIGLSAGWLPKPERPGMQLAVLLAFGFFWGFLYGVILNLYSWPLIAGDPATSWAPGAGVSDTLSRYATFYLLTSLVWDAMAALGNVVLLSILGIPTVRALTRFRDRLTFQVAAT